MVISIEKDISEMNLDIDRVFGLFFSLKYDLLYRLGLDEFLRVFVRPLQISPKVYLIDI